MRVTCDIEPILNNFCGFIGMSSLLPLPINIPMTSCVPWEIFWVKSWHHLQVLITFFHQYPPSSLWLPWEIPVSIKTYLFSSVKMCQQKAFLHTPYRQLLARYFTGLGLTNPCCLLLLFSFQLLQNSLGC